MLRNGRLLHLQRVHDLSHRPLLQRQIIQNLPPPRLRHRIKRIRSRRRSRHAPTIHSDMGICQALFFPAYLSTPQLLAQASLRTSAYSAPPRYLFSWFDKELCPSRGTTLLQASSAETRLLAQPHHHARRAPSSRSKLGRSSTLRHPRNVLQPSLVLVSYFSQDSAVCFKSTTKNFPADGRSVNKLFPVSSRDRQRSSFVPLFPTFHGPIIPSDG